MIKTTLGLRRFDKNHILLEEIKKPSRSWLKHFFDLMYEPLGYGTNTLALINDYGGVARTLAIWGGGNEYNANLQCNSTGGGTIHAIWGGGGSSYSNSAPLDGALIGIVIGTGVGAVAPTNDSLGTRIVHGEGAGQMLYGGCELFALTFANPNGSFVIRRYFTNESGGGITVSEVGIHSPARAGAGNLSYLFCIARDLTGGVLVNDTELLEVTYTAQITV